VTAPSDFALHGVDVSQYQGTWQIPQLADFVICRATFGARVDKRAVEHIEALRKRSCKVGLYHFFADWLSVGEQTTAFLDIAARCDLAPGDLIPWIDVEDSSGKGSNPPRPSWDEKLYAVREMIAEVHGGCGLYITQRDWSLLGKPSWVLEVPLWVAHWRTTPGVYASPGGVRPALIQYRVGPWDRGALHQGQVNAPNAIDHDLCTGALPLILDPEVDPVLPQNPEVPEPHLFELNLTDDDWAQMRRERDQQLKDIDR
jgi:hypothetical protein